MGGVEANQLAKVNERVLRRIAGTISIPVYMGTAPGEFTIENSAVLRQDKIWSTLRQAGRGTLQLPTDEFVDGKWVTRVDKYTVALICSRN